MENKDIYNKIKNEVLDTYPKDGINIVIPGKLNSAIQLTSTTNEFNSLHNSNKTHLLEMNQNMSMIDFKDCEASLKKAYNIDQNDPLIILKYEKITNIAREKNIQFEVYDPITFKRLNLSICSDNNEGIDVVIPIELDEDIKKLYNSLKEEGYDLFDLNNKFYFDICTPYTAENGADILLDDRLLYFYSQVMNISTCPNNCKYSKFYIEIR